MKLKAAALSTYQSEILFGLTFLVTLLLFPFQLRYIVSNVLTYILLAILGGSIIWQKLKRPGLTFLTGKRSLLIFVFSALMVLSLYGPNLRAQWSPIDDHEIMLYLGNDGQMGLTEVFSWFARSEAFSPGTSLRYRPTYQLLRLVESALWDSHPEFWYALRILILIFFLSVVWWLVSQEFGFLSGGVTAFFVLSFDFWKDILARLGPSEAYATFGLGLFCLSAYLILKQLRTHKPSWQLWLSLAVSVLISVGSKENMVLLLLPILLIGAVTLYYRRATVAAGGSLLFSIGWTLFITASVVIAISRAGHDVYDQSVSSASRLSLLILSFKTQQSKQLLTILVVLVIGWLFAFLRARDKNLIKWLTITISAVSFSLLVFVSQFVFYSGHWPDHSRYDFPGALYQILCFFALFWLIKRLLPYLKLPTAMSVGAKYGILLGIGFLCVMRGFVGVQVAVAQNVRDTRNFTSRINTLASTFKTHPDYPVIVESTDVWDYEPIYSYQLFLRSKGVTNNFALRLHGYSDKTVKPNIEKSLAAELEAISQRGNNAYIPFSPSLTQGGKCFSMFLTGNFATECQAVN